MAPGAKQAMSDALKTACGWAFCVVALYALLFANVSGNGALWDSLRGIIRDVEPAPVSMSAAVTLTAPARPEATAAKAQDRMLMISDQLAQQQPARAVDQITDAPADAKAGKDWRMHLTTTLRKFTIYGDGEQRSSASISAAPAHAASGTSSVPAAPTPATSFSAYRAGVSAEARPGVSDRVAPMDTAASDGVRNFR
jgi:hypothetical protein